MGLYSGLIFEVCQHNVSGHCFEKLRSSQTVLQAGDLNGALVELEKAQQLSQQLQDPTHDADLWGEVADTYADLGDYEKAAQVSARP